jgi:hypothetical protein
MWLELFAMWKSGIVRMSAEWWVKDLEAMTVLANEARLIEEHESRSADAGPSGLRKLVRNESWPETTEGGRGPWEQTRE